MSEQVTILTVAPEHYDLPGTQTLVANIGRLASDDRKVFRKVAVPLREAMRQVHRYRAGFWSVLEEREWSAVVRAGIVLEGA